MTREEGEKFAERMGTLFVGASRVCVPPLTTRVLGQDQCRRNRGVPGARQTRESRCAYWPCVRSRQILDTPSLWQRGPQPVRAPGAVSLSEDNSGVLGGCSC